MKDLVLCAWGQLVCFASSAVNSTVKNVMPEDTLACLIIKLSGCHKL